MSAYRDAHPLIVKACKRCGMEFEPNHGGQLYCSSVCRGKHHTDNRYPKIYSECAQCGKRYGEPSDNKFCTRKCLYESMRVTRPTRECKHCGNEFVLPHRSKKEPMIYCSNECKFADMRNPTNGTKHTCHECGVLFCAWGDRVRRFCSDVCATKNENRKRSALHRGASVTEDVSLTAVALRDKWICGICHKSVDKSLKFPDRMSASVDHITPVSLGGTHTFYNVQLSHLLCNVRKGNKIPPAPSESLPG